MAGERRLYLERNCRLPESPAHSRRRNREGPASSKGLNSQRGFGPAVEPRRKSRPRSTSLHGSSPCKCQRLSTLRWDRLPPSRPSTKSGACAGGRRLSDRRLHRWLAGTSASAPSSHGAADLLGLNRAHICVRNQKIVRDDRAHDKRVGGGRGDSMKTELLYLDACPSYKQTWPAGGLAPLAARGESPAAFDRRYIPPGCVVHQSSTAGILLLLALPGGRITGLGATLDFHHGLLRGGGSGRGSG